MASVLKRSFGIKQNVFRSFGSRYISTTNKPNYAFAFDIDGVLIKVHL